MQRSSRLLLLVVLVMSRSAVGGAQVATSAGDVIADVIPPEPLNGFFGKAIGYDGGYLYYTEWAGSILHRINIPPKGSSYAAGHIDIPILGTPSGVMAISYDARRDAFWAIGGDGLSMYLLQKSGLATLQFTINPATDRPGNCKPGGITWTAVCPTETKINYDGTDDTIWYAPNTSKRIYHYRATPSPIGTAQLVDGTPWLDVDVPPNDMTPECGYSQVSGIAVGGPYVIVNVAGCPHYFKYLKDGTKLGVYPMQPPSGDPPSGDLECDSRSYDVWVLWARDGWNGHIYAFQQPFNGACVFGGG